MYARERRIFTSYQQYIYSFLYHAVFRHIYVRMSVDMLGILT